MVGDWKFLHIGVQGDDARIGSLAIWNHDWRPTERDAVMLPHPQYPSQTHRYDIYDIGNEPGIATFAVGELSYGVWAFYVPVRQRHT